MSKTEEPKEHWTIGHDGAIFKLSEWENQKDHEEIGNYFETKEEAEKVVKKLKAWTRLKDKGFRFTGCSLPSDKGMCICYETDIETWSMQDLQDFKTLFGGGK